MGSPWPCCVHAGLHVSTRPQHPPVCLHALITTHAARLVCDKSLSCILNYIFMPSRHSHLHFLSHLIAFSVDFTLPLSKNRTASSSCHLHFFFFNLTCQVRIPTFPTKSLILKGLKVYSTLCPQQQPLPTLLPPADIQLLAAPSIILAIQYWKLLKLAQVYWAKSSH